jgi:YD repeat-containing protein
VSFGYDGDSLLTGSGTLSVTRDPQTGLATGTTLGQVTDATTYNDFGEPLTYSASFNGTQLYAVQHAHDLLGRITEKTETIGGTSHVYAYTYDLAGRLTDVMTDASLTVHYDYDANSNRVGGFNQLCTPISNARIDDQDRLSAIDCGLSTAFYSYTGNGELFTKTDGNGTTTYTYDVLATSPPSPCQTGRRSNTSSTGRTGGLARRSTGHWCKGSCTKISSGR